MQDLTPRRRSAELARLRIVDRVLDQWPSAETLRLDEPTLRGLAELRRMRTELLADLSDGAILTELAGCISTTGLG